MIIFTIISLFASWPRRRILSQVLIVLAIWVYAFLVGLPPSVVRAATMITVYALLSIGYRERMSVNTLAFVAIIMLIISPSMLYDVGFQLSFMAVLSIVLWHPLLNGLIPLHVQQRHQWLSSLWGLITVSTAAQIGTAPLVAYYFGRLPVWFLLSNFIVIPLATVVLYLTLALVVFNWWTWAATLVAKVLTAVVVTMERGLAWVGALPYSSIDGIQLSVLRVYLIYIIIGSLFVAVSIRFPAIRRSV
jgi:competence protein ComEC